MITEAAELTRPGQTTPTKKVESTKSPKHGAINKNALSADDDYYDNIDYKEYYDDDEKSTKSDVKLATVEATKATTTVVVKSTDDKDIKLRPIEKKKVLVTYNK